VHLHLQQTFVLGPLHNGMIQGAFQQFGHNTDYIDPHGAKVSRAAQRKIFKQL
jgi:hypothetical protein